MLLFIVPVFAKMFNTLGGKLPLPTQILVGHQQHLEDATFPVLIIFIIALVIVWEKIKH